MILSFFNLHLSFYATFRLIHKLRNLYPIKNEILYEKLLNIPKQGCFSKKENVFLKVGIKQAAKWRHVLDTGGRLDPFQVAVGHLSLTVIATKSSYDFKNGG